MSNTGNRAFLRGFSQGLAIVFLLIALIFTATILQSGKTLKNLEAQLASQTVIIQRGAPAAATEIQPQPALQPQDQEINHETHAPEASGYTVPAPVVNKDLIEVTPQGPLPKKSDSGDTPFNAYKRPYKYDGRPTIVLAVLDFGLSDENSKAALQALPPGVSFILSPYANEPEAWKNLSVAEGHELWLHVPAETERYPAEDPGPQGLLSRASFQSNQAKLVWAMSRTSGYAGIATYTDKSFDYVQTVLKGLFDEMFNRGLGYFELNPAGMDFIEVSAVDKESPYAKNRLIFDEATQSPQAWIKTLEEAATTDGFAVGVIKPYPELIKALSAWAAQPDVSSRFAFAPISALATPDKQPAPANAPAH